MAALVEMWMSELAKLGEKVGRPRKQSLSQAIKPTHRSPGEDEEEEEGVPSSVFTLPLKSRAIRAKTHHEATLSEATIRLLMDCFSPC